MYTGMPMLLHAWLLACRCVVNRLALRLDSRVLQRSETSYAPEAGGAVTAAGKPCWVNRMRSEFRAHQLLFRCEEVPSPLGPAKPLCTEDVFPGCLGWPACWFHVFCPSCLVW